jgi:hypothetical protein
VTYHYDDNHRCMIQHALARISGSLAAREPGAVVARAANRVRGEGAAGGAPPGA